MCIGIAHGVWPRSGRDLRAEVGVKRPIACSSYLGASVNPHWSACEGVVDCVWYGGDSKDELRHPGGLMLKGSSTEDGTGRGGFHKGSYSVFCSPSFL